MFLLLSKTGKIIFESCAVPVKNDLLFTDITCSFPEQDWTKKTCVQWDINPLKNTPPLFCQASS